MWRRFGGNLRSLVRRCIPTESGEAAQNTGRRYTTDSETDPASGYGNHTESYGRFEHNVLPVNRLQAFYASEMRGDTSAAGLPTESPPAASKGHHEAIRRT